MVSEKWLKGFVLLIVLGIALPVVVYQAPIVSASETEVSKSEYTPHDPIYINRNLQFTPENGVSSGNGTQSNPYIIEGWDINANSAHGFEIINTDKYFIIRNCVIHDSTDGRSGIIFNNVTNGKIDNVTSYNNYYGIYLHSSSNNQITNYTVYNNSYGIYLYSSSNNQITNYTVYNNSYGIYLHSSSNNNITNCAVYNNSDDGILLYSSSNNVLNGNSVYNNNYGIRLDSSNNNVIMNSQIFNNNNYGIYLYSNNNQITYCNITDNTNYGVYLCSNSNIFHHNNFINNSKNAHDAYTNYWDDGIGEGNYWSDYNGDDADGDGIGDWVKSIPGGPNVDMYPLMSPVNIPMNIPPIAGFTYYPSNPTDLDTVQFNSTSTDADGTIVNYYWEFGDGNTSTVQNTTHQYTIPDTYNVTLTVTDNDGATNSTTKKITVSPWETPVSPPNASFTYSPANPTTIDTVQFTDTSTDPDGTITEWYWEFGDGSTSTLQNPTHQYTTAGNYTVSLTVYDNDGATNSSSSSIEVTAASKERIYIDGNSQFTAENGVSSGTGTATNPYIIEGKNIDGQGGYGITIKNTDAYFIIRDCVIHNGAGISFDSVKNGKIDNVNSCGIYLKSSSSNEIIDSTIHDADSGIYLFSSSNNNKITNCVVYNNDKGIFLHYNSKNNQITYCNVYNNSIGIYLAYYSQNNQITHCDIHDNTYGLYLYDSKNNKINYCNIYNNKEYGLFNNEQYEMYYTVDATNNWWGSADGCSGAGSGSGDKVITYILSGTQDNDAIIYDPWLTSKDGVTVTDGGDTTDGSEEGVKEEKGKQVCGVIYLPLIIVGICMIVLRDRRKQRF